MRAVDFSHPAPEIAQILIGWRLYNLGTRGLTGGIIIETEAYTADDPASHSYKGMNKRNQSMFMGPGTLYLYRIYGLHTCMNIVTGNHDGQAVLIRALLPTIGYELMRVNRHDASLKRLCEGPANIVRALGIDLGLDGTHIDSSSVILCPPKQSLNAVALPRIGITKAREVLWRFRAEDM